MEALKISKNTELKNDVERARIFFRNLANQKYGPDFQMYKTFDGKALVQLQNHFEKYSLDHTIWSRPEKGLLLVASTESEAFLFFALLNIYLSELWEKEKKKFVGIKTRFEGSLLKIAIISTLDLVLELHKKVKVETVLKNNESDYLCLLDFGQDSVIKIDYFNKFDIVSEILRIRYLKKVKDKSKQITYLLTNLSFDELSDRYGPDTLFHMNKLVDLIILNNPKT